MDQRDQVVVIHIAGMNGKWSAVALKVAKIFELAGYNLGLFVSPHIASLRERMQTNSEPITELEVEELLPKIYDICEEEEIPATFFEVSTALACFTFFQNNLSVITSIGLEHAMFQELRLWEELTSALQKKQE